MVETQSLDLETADAEHFELFYLVDCVLDEIEQAKALRRKCDPDGEPELIMPVADSEDLCQADLMDHIENALSPFDDGATIYPSFYDGTYQQHRSVQSTSAHEKSSIADDLVEQIYMDNEYLAFAGKDNTGEPPYSSACKNSAKPSAAQHTVTSGECEVPEDILQSAMSLQSFVKHSCITMNKSTDTQSQVTGKVHPELSLNKDYLKHFDELQQYSDLIQLPDMASRFPSTTAASSHTQSTNFPTNQQLNTVIPTHNFCDEDSNDTTASEIMSWTMKHPENWSTTEVLDWLYYSAEKHGADCSLLRGESFRTVTGEMLCQMNSEDYKALDPYYGEFFYKLFRQLINGLNFSLPSESSFSEPSDLDQSYSFIDAQSGTYTMSTSPNDITHSHVTSDVSPVPSAIQTNPDVYPQGADTLGPCDFIYASASGSQHHQSAETGSVITQQTTYNYTLGLQSVSYSYEYPASQYPLSPKSQYKMSARERYDTNSIPRRRPGRPRIKSMPTEEELQAQREKKMKSQHLWEFIYDMLNNPMYNPAILKWENQNEGVFRFVQSESVAQLWGTLKSNENMTYEKLSRAMRHYYKRGILERVEGRRLVYKFSRGTLDRMRQKKNLATDIPT